MIEYITCILKSDLTGILDLQKANHLNVLSPGESHSQGFVTVSHTFDELKKLNDIEKHIIAKDGNKIIAYLLAMTKESKFDLPILIPMFNLFDEIKYENKYISDYNYIVVGQVCVEKQFRGQGIFDQCHLTYRN